MYLLFGVGTALKHFEETDEWQKVQDLYDNSMFQNFIRKQYDVDGEILFPLTAYMKTILSL
jgi:phosphoenolpyruvate carboxylase